LLAELVNSVILVSCAIETGLREHFLKSTIHESFFQAPAATCKTITDRAESPDTSCLSHPKNLYE